MLKSFAASVPQPSAVMSVPSSVFCETASMDAFSTFRTLPFSGRMAWNFRSRPLFALPPADSPYTM